MPVGTECIVMSPFKKSEISNERSSLHSLPVCPYMHKDILPTCRIRIIDVEIDFV